MKKFLLHFEVLVLSCVVLAVAVNGAFSQSYPNKPIRIIVANAPGGPNDIRARLVAEKLTESWGQQVYVENVAGANEAIGMEKGAKSAPDGYTLVWVTKGALVAMPCLRKTVPYDPLKDYEHITQVTSTPTLLVVKPSLAAKSMKELVALAKAKPGQLNYAAPSGTAFLTMEMFKLRAGIDIVHIPFKGAAPAMLSLISGELDMLVDTPLASIPHIQSGKARALAVGSAKRSAALPDVPTVSESGFPGFEASVWGGIVAPAGTPKEIIKKLNAELIRIMLMPAVKDRLEAGGDQIVVSTPEQFAAHAKAELERYTKVVRDAKIARIE